MAFRRKQRGGYEPTGKLYILTDIMHVLEALENRYDTRSGYAQGWEAALEAVGLGFGLERVSDPRRPTVEVIEPARLRLEAGR